MTSIEFYQDKRDKWRWRITSRNNEIIGASSQGFKNRSDAIVNLELVQGART